MAPTAVLEPAKLPHQRYNPKQSWWSEEGIFRAVRDKHKSFQGAAVCNYKFGDSLIQIRVDHPSLLDSIDLFYGECAVRTANGLPVIECIISGAIHPQLIWIGFTGGIPDDLAAVTLGLLHPPAGEPSYAISDSDRTGWKLVGGANQPVAAVCNHGLLIDRTRVPNDFLAEFVVAVTLVGQVEIIALHAAGNILPGDTGVLLTGSSRAGKTTTSLHLAARGHALLGDELAIVRLANRELVPFRKALSLRPGPRGPVLSTALNRMPPRTDPSGSGKIGPYRVDELFPDSVARPVRLKAVFFLSGMAEHPSLEPFQLTMNHAKIFDYMAANDIASVTWGITATRRAMRLFAIKRTMGCLPCWMLTVGAPEETAQLIEQTVIDSNRGK